MKIRILTPLFLLWPGLLSAADLELASPFVDHAILQREMKVPVWGWATPGTQVTVAFAGQEHVATTTADGTWRVDLDPLVASAEARPLVVKDAGGESITRNDILVGEVWLASGQSNMDWLASKSNCGPLAREVAKAKLPIREYTVDIGSSLFPCSRAASEAGWKTPDKGDFSALALAFAAEIQRELGVPVGILRSSHGATPVETWTAYEGFAAQPELQNIVLNIHESDPGTPAGQTAYARYYGELAQWQEESAKLVEKGGVALPRPPLPGIAGDWKGATRMHNKKIAPLAPYAIRGVIWCQGEHNSGNGKIYAAKMEALLKGWRKHWDRPELPFYFTQLQCYGDPGPDQVGFADAREAQTLFYKNNTHVGMVVQTDLNPARPQGIHPSNKLDPGKRLARWALANDYGRKDLAFTGPMMESYQVKDAKVRVKFTQRGPGGGLMVGSKGMEADAKSNPDAFVEPARETPGAPLQHFRLAGKDRVWHPAQAVIDGDEVVVSSAQVPEPVGVQYAYNASPIGSNLCNRAGLPAIPFAMFEGKQLFQEDLPKPEAVTAKPAGSNSRLAVPSLIRNGMILQRDQKVPLWGFGIPGSEITIRFGGQEKKATVDEFEKWHTELDPMPAAATDRDMEIRSSASESVIIRDVLVGDVWFLTGSSAISGMILGSKGADAVPAEALPLAREFRIKTKARRFQTERKRQMEVGGASASSWEAITFDKPEKAISVFGYHFAKAAQQPGVPIGLITLGSDCPPLTWISLEGMQNATGFEKERDEINLSYPNTAAFKKAFDAFLESTKSYVSKVAELRKAGKEIPADLATPGFPEPYYNQWANYTETATHTYNFCVSPLTPCAVRGVVWMPSETNLGTDKTRYAKSVAAYARSLPDTYGQAKVPFIFAHPAAMLPTGSEAPDLPDAARVDFSEWPKSLAEIASKLGAAAK